MPMLWHPVPCRLISVKVLTVDEELVGLPACPYLRVFAVSHRELDSTYLGRVEGILFGKDTTS